jgi:hypothetical protein
MSIEVVGLSVGACNVFFHVSVIFFLKKEMDNRLSIPYKRKKT